MIYVLDTDVTRFLEQLHPPAVRRLSEVLSIEGNEVVAAIVTVEERISGRLPKCRRAKDGRERVKAYADLQDSIMLLLNRKWLPLTSQAAIIFDQLRPIKSRIGANDTGIAAITLSVNGILVTHNTVDFERVPNLTLEDWTK